MNKQKFDTYLKKLYEELNKDYRYEKERCSRLYPDWKDDEFNMLDNLFIWGYNIDKNITPSFYSWDDAYIYYNRVSKKYFMTIDTGFYNLKYNAELARTEIQRLREIDLAFRNFLAENDLPMIEPVFPYNDPALEADTLPQLYFKFRVMLEGYKQYLH